MAHGPAQLIVIGRRARVAADGFRRRSGAARARAGNGARSWRAAARSLAGTGGGWAAAGSGAEPAWLMGPHGHHALRSRAALFTHTDQSSDARHLVHTYRVERSALRAAGLSRLVPALGTRVGAHRRHDLGAVCRRAHH